MTPEELEKLPKPLERTMTVLEMDIMLEVVNRIQECSQITPVTDWLLNRMTAIGMSKKRIKEILREGVKTAGIDIDEIYETAARSDYVRNSEIYKAAGMDAVPYEDNDWLKQVVQAVKDQTADSLKPMENITKMTGFNVPMGNGKKVFTPMSEYLERSLDEAMMKITTGAKTYSQAIGDVIDEMTSSGVRVVDYASGKSDRIEVAARRAVMTGIAQMTDKVNEHNAKELGTDYWEVEWHLGARNTGTGYMNHQSWQGKVYSSAEMRTVCGLGEMLGFAGINCYHIRFPFIPGVSKRKYTDEWLAEQNRKENEKKTYRGKKYDTYAALQYQRKLERTIRKQKQDIKLLEKGGADKDDLTVARCRKRLTEKTYVEFSKAMDLRQQRERLKVGSGSDVSEKGITNKKIPKSEEYRINRDEIFSNEYLKKFRGISDNAIVDENICKYARAGLIHRDGTVKEDLYILSSRTGEILGKNINDALDYGVSPNKSVVEAVRNNPKNLIGLHTHPDGTPPTGSDFEVSGLRGYNFGVVACADGSVYTYKHSKQYVSKIYIDSTIEKYKKMIDSTGHKVYNSDIEAHLAALKRVSEEYGIYYEKR